MRNMRQFMSGIKNYLVKHGEKEFNKEVERERNKVSMGSNIWLQFNMLLLFFSLNQPNF